MCEGDTAWLLSEPGNALAGYIPAAIYDTPG